MTPSPVPATSWAAATPHTAATRAAADVLRDGGNAVDAALAAAATLTVVYPDQCSLGGDCIALVGLPDGSVHVVNGIGRAPRGLSVSDLDGRTAMPLDGPHPVTVPGAVGAWHTMASRWGSRDLGDVLPSAARHAADGVPVAPGLARDLDRESSRIMADAGLRAVFAPRDRLLRAGDPLVQPRLADSIRTIASEGPDAFYRGDIAGSIVSTLRAQGSRISTDDFARHETEVVAPVSATYDGTDYVTAPPPSQGAFFLEGVAALELVRADLGRPLDLDGTDAAVVAAVLQAAAHDRDALLADPDVAALDLDRLLGERAHHLAAGRTLLRDAPSNPPPTGDTVAVVTADGSGTWVSLIQSLFHAFGSGILDPASGIVLHNRGASFSLTPGHPALLRGGVRPPHTLMPVLTRSGGRFTGAHGTMGGRAQGQIHTQVALRLAHGDDPRTALSRPRWVLGPMEEGSRGQRTISAEADVPEVVKRALASSGFGVTELAPADDGTGHAQLVRAAGDGFVGASDPRSDGSFLTA